MKEKISLVIFIITIVSSIIYFTITPQESETKTYFDGPYIFSFNDSTYKSIEFTSVGKGSSSPDISIKYNLIPIKDFFNGILNCPTNSNQENGTIPSIFSKIDSVFSVGDVHGEFDALLTLLKNNHIITKEGNWNFGKGHLVFCGDIFDRGEKVTETLWFIYKLEKQAETRGGKVHLLLGNHEMMVLKGDLRYLHKKYKYIQRKLGVNYSFLYNKNTFLGKWLREKNTIVKINNVIYIHGGLHPDILKMKINLSEINKSIRNYLNDKDFNDTIRFLINQKGPLWYRGYLKANDNYSLILDEEIDETLAYFKVDRIVFAHTTVSSIKSLNGKKIIAIDVPMTDRNSEGLFFNNSDIYSVNNEGIKLEEF